MTVKMLGIESNCTEPANLTFTLPLKDSCSTTCSSGPLVPCSRTALVVSTVLLSGILGGALLGMAYLVLFGKCWARRKSMQRGFNDLKSNVEKLPEGERQSPGSRPAYCRSCGLNQQ